MKDLINKVRSAKSGRMFHGGKVKPFTVHEVNHAADYEFEVEMVGVRYIVSDAYDNLGFVYRAPDSGTIMTNMMVPLDDGEPDPTCIQDPATLQSQAFDAMKPVFESVTAGNTDPDDLDFCRQLFNSQEAMLRTIQKEGSLEKAHKAIIRDVFRIT